MCSKKHIIAYNMLKQIETAILRVEQRELQPLLAGVRFLIRYFCLLQGKTTRRMNNKIAFCTIFPLKRY